MLYDKGLTVARLQDKLYGDEHLPVGPDGTRVATEHTDLVGWFGDQIDVARSHFSKYLNLN